MSIEIKNKVKFRTLLICTNIILVLICQFGYICVNERKLNPFYQKLDSENLSVFHENFCNALQACLYESDILRSYIDRESLESYVNSNLNLIEDTASKAITENTEKSLKRISVSDSVISDFVMVAKNSNQKSLFVDTETREIRDNSFPTADVIEKSHLDAVLHTNLGHMVYCKKSLLNGAEFKSLKDDEVNDVSNLIEYLSDSYIMCDYINDNFIIIRFNPNYINNTVKILDDKKIIVYDLSGRTVMSFNASDEYAKGLFKSIDLSESVYKDSEHSYAISQGIHGKLFVVTEQKTGYINNFFDKTVLLYFLSAVIAIIFSFAFMAVFSGTIFRKISFIQSVIVRQKEAHHLHLIKSDERCKSRIKLSFSYRIFLTLISSCLASLLMISLVFNMNLGKDCQSVTKQYGEQMLKNYLNEWMISYNRYNSISENKFENILSLNQNGNDTALIDDFERDFFYDITFLPNYKYALIVNNNNEVLYQTMFPSQKQISASIVQQVISKFEGSDLLNHDGMFIPLYDRLSGDKTVAYVKKIDKNNKISGTVIIVLNAANVAIETENEDFRCDFLILNENNDIAVGNASDFDPIYIARQKAFDESRGIYYSYNDENQWIGKVVALTRNEFLVSQFKEIRYFLFLSAFVIGIICVIFTFLLARILSKPFKIIVENINDTPNIGYHSIREKFGVDEVDTIAVAYNQMINRIEALVDEGIHKETERQRLEVLQTLTELKMLQQQINPHFLFNTLECINMLALKNGETDISENIKSLANILRYSISRETKVKVGREIKVLQSYIEIQKYRFGNSFNVEFELDETLFDVSIIKFVLQPLFENCISHGKVQTVENGKIKLILRNYDEGVEFIVSDNGIGMSDEKLADLRNSFCSVTEDDESKTGGIGLKNVYRRILLYYDGKGKLEINSIEGEGTQVILRLPFM